MQDYSITSDKTAITITESECYFYSSQHKYVFAFVTAVYCMIVLSSGCGYGIHCGQYFKTETDLINDYTEKLRQNNQPKSNQQKQTEQHERSQFCSIMHAIWKCLRSKLACADLCAEFIEYHSIRPYSRCSLLFCGWIFNRLRIIFTCIVYAAVLVFTWLWFTFRKGSINYVNQHNPWIFCLSIVYIMHAIAFVCHFGTNTYPTFNKFVKKLIGSLILLFLCFIISGLLVFFQHRNDIPTTFDLGIFNVFRSDYDKNYGIISFCFPNTISIFGESITSALNDENRMYTSENSIQTSDLTQNTAENILLLCVYILTAILFIHHVLVMIVVCASSKTIQLCCCGVSSKQWRASDRYLLNNTRRQKLFKQNRRRSRELNIQRRNNNSKMKLNKTTKSGYDITANHSQNHQGFDQTQSHKKQIGHVTDHENIQFINDGISMEIGGANVSPRAAHRDRHHSSAAVNVEQQIGEGNSQQLNRFPVRKRPSVIVGTNPNNINYRYLRSKSQNNIFQDEQFSKHHGHYAHDDRLTQSESMNLYNDYDDGSSDRTARLQRRSSFPSSRFGKTFPHKPYVPNIKPLPPVSSSLKTRFPRGINNEHGSSPPPKMSFVDENINGNNRQQQQQRIGTSISQSSVVSKGNVVLQDTLSDHELSDHFDEQIHPLAPNINEYNDLIEEAPNSQGMYYIEKENQLRRQKQRDERQMLWERQRKANLLNIARMSQSRTYPYDDREMI